MARHVVCDRMAHRSEVSTLIFTFISLILRRLVTRKQYQCCTNICFWMLQVCVKAPWLFSAPEYFWVCSVQSLKSLIIMPAVPVRGKIMVDEGCAQAIQQKKNVHAVGILGVQGDFGVMDAVELICGNWSIARGLTNYTCQVRPLDSSCCLYHMQYTLFHLSDSICMREKVSIRFSVLLDRWSGQYLQLVVYNHMWTHPFQACGVSLYRKQPLILGHGLSRHLSNVQQHQKFRLVSPRLIWKRGSFDHGLHVCEGTNLKLMSSRLRMLFHQFCFLWELIQSFIGHMSWVRRRDRTHHSSCCWQSHLGFFGLELLSHLHEYRCLAKVWQPKLSGAA